MLTGRRGDIDGLINVCWLSWSTLVAGGDSEQILLPFNHIGNGELLILDSCDHLKKRTEKQIFKLLLDVRSKSSL